jgi:AFG3 family protein
MNPRLGLVSFPPDDGQSLNKPYSEDTARLIDSEVRDLVAAAYERTLTVRGVERAGVCVERE